MCIFGMRTESAIVHTSSELAANSNVALFGGQLGQLWFDQSYVDLSIQSNIERFVSGTGANAKPVYFGATGEKPTGSQQFLVD